MEHFSTWKISNATLKLKSSEESWTTGSAGSIEYVDTYRYRV